MLRRLLAHPLIPGILALGAPLAGFWVAIRNDAIKAALDVYLQTLNVPPTILGVDANLFIFLLFLTLLGAGFALHRWADAALASKRQGQLERNIRVIATLGIERAAEQFREAIQGSFDAATVAFVDTATRTQLAAAIRIVIGNLAVFAKELDGAAKTTAYSCSLMIYWSQEKLLAMSPKRLEALQARAVFRDHITTEPRQLAGMLELRRELTTSTVLAGKEPDRLAQELVLPVVAPTFLMTGRGRKYKVLPGAPFSAATREFCVFRSIADLLAWCEQDADFSDGLRQEIANYFATGPGKNVKSFAAIPILASASDGGEAPVIATLALQCSRAQILPAERHEIFMQIVTPFLLLIALLLATYLAKETD
jgi:hypothetical protein